MRKNYTFENLKRLCGHIETVEINVDYAHEETVRGWEEKKDCGECFRKKMSQKKEREDSIINAVKKELKEKGINYASSIFSVENGGKSVCVTLWIDVKT